MISFNYWAYLDTTSRVVLSIFTAPQTLFSMRADALYQGMPLLDKCESYSEKRGQCCLSNLRAAARPSKIVPLFRTATPQNQLLQQGGQNKDCVTLDPASNKLQDIDLSQHHNTETQWVQKGDYIVYVRGNANINDIDEAVPGPNSIDDPGND
ncbi:hypothetical protein PoB_002853900 [Plakobranchus ocellatus]|uniref:Uncharacterized protein n=1 Tax=Plakobranchus ocellatus TaxID=259542 RepID=A0AAV4A646_9GAST|nr:hypothetical protein PoB_002853900 [Plakobranchus ocellatus]